MSITVKILKNSSANLISFIWNSLLFLFMTPLMLNKLGDANYGIVALTATFTGFLGFLDLGFTGAAVKQVSESYAKKNFKRINEVINLSLIVYLMMGAVASGLLIAFVNSSFITYFKVEEQFVNNFKFALYIASCNIIINIILGAFSNIPYALQMNGIQAKCNILLSLAYNLVTAGFLLFGYGLKTVMILKLLSSIVGLVVYYHVARNLVNNLKLAVYFDKPLFKEMVSFSAYDAITQLSQPFFGLFDRVLLGMFVNVTAVTYYIVPISLAAKTQNIIANITNTIFPLTSELLAINDLEKIKSLYIKSLKVVFFISCLMLVPLFIYSENILSIWMGKDFAVRSNSILRIALVFYLFLSSNSVCYFIFNGLNKPKINTAYTLISSVIKIVFCFILIPSFWALGAAIALLISAVPIFFFILYFERMMGIKGWYFLTKVYAPGIITSLIVILTFSIYKYNGSNIMIVGLLGFLSMIAFILGCLISGYFDREDINKYKGYILRVFKGGKPDSKYL